MIPKVAEVEPSVLQRFVRHLEWARDLTVRESVFRRPIFLVDEVMGEPAVEIQTETLSKRALEARAATDRLSRLTFEERQETLREARISPELIYEIYRQAEAERDLDEAFGWTDHLVHIEERLIAENKRGGEINEALAPGYTLRLDLSLDLAHPWAPLKFHRHPSSRMPELPSVGRWLSLPWLSDGRKTSALRFVRLTSPPRRRFGPRSGRRANDVCSFQHLDVDRGVFVSEGFYSSVEMAPAFDSQ